MLRCQCCDREITMQQSNFSGGLCALCDTGRCRRPEEYHKLEKEIERLKQELREPYKDEKWNKLK